MTWSRWVRRAIRVHRGRFMFATVSVVLGVTAYLGVSIGTGTMAQALRIQQGQNSAGSTRGVYLVPTGVWNARGPRADAEAIGHLKGVANVQPGLGLAVRLASDSQAGTWEQAYVYGVPVASLPKLASGRQPSDGADELLVGDDIAARIGWKLGDTVTIPTRDGPVAASVVGLARASGSVNTSLATAQRYVGAGDVVEGVYVAMRRGVNAQAWADAHVAQTGVFQRQPSTIFDSDAISFFRQVERSVTPIASAALIMGAFLIYVTISRTVLDRQRDHAALRAVGATRRRVLGLVLIEAVAVGVVGTAIGLVVGLVVARGVANLMSGVFNVSIALVPKLDAPTHVIVQAIVLGLATPLVAAAIPAIRAGRDDPAVLLRGDAIEAAPTRRVAVAGAAVFVAGVALTVGASERAKPLGMAVCLVGLVMSGPLLTAFVGRGLQAAMRISPLGEMAAQRISRKPGRSARTAALLAATLSMVVILLIIGASGRVGFVRLVNANTAGDVGVRTPSGFTFTPSQVDDIGRLPGVTAVTDGAQGAVRVLDPGGHAEFLSAIDPATYFGVGDFAWTRSSSTRAARAALSRPGNVLLATTISQRIRRRVGDSVTLQTQRGPHRFRIAGTYAGLATGDTHAVVMSVADATRWFGYHGATRLRIVTQPGQAAAVAARLEATPLHPNISLLALQREANIQGFDGAWSLVALTGVIASAIGLMGLVNTMVMEVVDRRHEIGVLRAVGASRGDVRRVVSLEALGFGVMAGIVGIAAGSIIGRASMTGLAHDSEVAQVFRFSPVALPLVTVLALVAGVVAGRLPARRAGAIDPAVVLRSL